MKIIYGITKSNFFGAQRYVYDMATEAKKAGHKVTVLCGGNGPLVKRLSEEKIRVIKLPSLERDVYLLKEIKSFIEIFKILKAENPDIFHTNSSKMGALGALAGRLARTKKIIFTAHGWAFNEARPLWQKWLIMLIHWATVILSHKTICVSEKTKWDISKLPFLKKKLVVIRNGIKPFEILPREDARKKLGLDTDSLVIGAVGELHHIKGLNILFQAWKEFVTTHKAKLILVGEGEERENLQNMAQILGISDSVIFKGYVNNARALLSALDIFVMPSLSENLPYALLEAGYAGLPVIASAVGGIPEIVGSGVSGILVFRKDFEAIRSSLILLAEDKGLRERLGQELKKVIREHFSTDKMVRDTLEIYV